MGDFNGNLSALSKLCRQMQRDEENPALFLAAWKAAVKIAGVQYFNVLSVGVDSATNRNQLRPNWEMIRETLDALSSGEATFLIALYQFYCASDIQTLCGEAGIPMPTLNEMACLDHDQINVICRLMQSYYGW